MRTFIVTIAAVLLLTCPLHAQTKEEKKQAADKDKTVTPSDEELNFCQRLRSSTKDEKDKVDETVRRLWRIHTDAGELPADDVIFGKWDRYLRVPYPPEARRNRISGFVVLRILVDEKGKIVRANAVCGHEQLRKAVEEAALRASYTPFTLNGKPVRMSGILFYRFALQ